MAAEAEGITLLSMYEDEEDDLAPSEGNGAGEETNGNSKDDKLRIDCLTLPVRDKTLQMLTSSPIRTKDCADSRTPRSPLQQGVSGSQPYCPVRLITHTPPTSPAPLFSLLEPSFGRRVHRGAVTIVDYAHDEAAMSPKTKEEEKKGSGCILMGTELQGFDRDSEGTTHITSKILTPNNQYECLQPSDVLDLSKTKFSMDMDCTGFGREVVGVETSASISSDLQKDDPLQKFLPPALTVQCSEELQEKINKFLAYKRAGKSFNAYLRKKKDYRNPDFLQHAVRYQDIEQIGTCFGKETFDPYGYDKSDFYDEIEADMKREMERKAQERKRSKKIDFVSGGIQSGEAALVALKMNSKIPSNNYAVGISTVVNNEFQPVSTTVDVVRDGRLNKKSKWDKE